MKLHKFMRCIIISSVVILMACFVFPAHAQSLEDIDLPSIPTIDKPIKDMTIQELQTKISEILAAIQQSQDILVQLTEQLDISGIPSNYTFDTNLRYGTSSNEVKYLQIFLNVDPDTIVSTTGWGSPGNESMYFGKKTLSTVIKFQEKYASEVLSSWNISNGTGYVGTSTRKKINQLLEQYRSDITPGEPLTYCGDGIIQTPNSKGIYEVCDLANLKGQTCHGLGYASGTLSCSSDCLTYNTANCVRASDDDGGECGDGECNGSENCSTCPQDCGPCSLLPQDYISYWKFEGNTNDEKGVNNGTLMRNASIGIDSEKGNILSLGGYGDYVEVADSGSLDIESQISLSVWVKLKGYSSWPKIIIKPYQTYADPWELYAIDLRGSGDTPRFRFILTDGIPRGDSATLVYDSTISLNQWYHIVGTYNGNTANLYIDGNFITSQSADFDIGTNNMPLGIGARLGMDDVNGLIDDVMIYNRALTAVEVSNIYDIQKIEPTTPVCGDGSCNGTETCFTCPQDCGPCLIENTYYIDTANGNDNNDGSYNTPWRTITFAKDAVSSGDTIIVRPGDYSSEGTISLTNGGAAGNMITIKSEPRRQAVIAKLNINAPYIRIEAFEITNDIDGREGGGIIINSDNIEIIDNYIHHIWYMGIFSPGSNDVYIADNYMYHVGFGMVIDGNDWIVENNEIERLYQVVPRAQGGSDADFSRFFGRNHIIRNNYFHGNVQSEIGDAHTDCFQTYNVGGSFAHNITIEKNRCEGFFSQGVIGRTTTTGYLTDIKIRNNIFAGNGNNAWGVMGQNLEDAVIVNNVISNIRYYGVGLNDASDNAIIMNNIFYDIGGMVYYSNGANLNGDYNIIYGDGSTPHTGPHDLVDVNPLFVDPANYNFRLQSNSPAIDAGTDTSGYGVTDDIEGNSRPQGNGFDIGAYECLGLECSVDDDCPADGCYSGEYRNYSCISNSCEYEDITTDESISGGNCEDGLDNDCDGLTDEDDEGCVVTACGDGVCEAGENCPADAGGCADNICYEPTCTNGCGQTAVLEGDTDESCLSPNMCDGAGNCIADPCVGITQCSDYTVQNECENNDCGVTGSCQWNAGVCEPASIPITTSISQFGITWTFSGSVEYGQFANGDYWVVGPVTIVGITPISRNDGTGRIVHGSMFNPSPTSQYDQGYDSAMYGGYDQGWYIPNLNIARPNGQQLSSSNSLTIQTGSLVSTISLPSTHEFYGRTVLQSAAILTVLSSPAPEGSFRPSYCGSDKTIRFNKNQLDYSYFKSLTSVASTPRLEQQQGDSLYDSVERTFERPWLDHIPLYGGMGRQHHPYENMPNYGGHPTGIGAEGGIAVLMLNLDYTNQQKEKLLIRFVQLGIDQYGIIQDGGRENFIGAGAQTPGHKLPILFAGVVLNDNNMRNIGAKSGDYLYSGGYGAGNPPPDYIHFGEDDQTFYVTQSDISLSNYVAGDLGLPEWGITHATGPSNDNRNWGAGYRPVAGPSFPSMVLAAHMMDIKDLWNHDALFDYTDRYMDVETGWLPTQFVRNMWNAYREDYGCIWTRYNQSDIYSNGYNPCE